MNEPSEADKTLCMTYRKLSKQGHYTPEGMDFCTKMFTKYPDWYASTNSEIKQIKPFGARES